MVGVWLIYQRTILGRDVCKTLLQSWPAFAVWYLNYYRTFSTNILLYLLSSFHVCDDVARNFMSFEMFVDSVHATYLKFNSSALENPILRSYSDPCVIEPLHQIKGSSQVATHRCIPSKNLAACFAATQTRNKRHCEWCSYY